MKFIKTAERISKADLSDNYVFQRSLFAYAEAAKLVSGKVLEIGTGSGYGIEIIAPHTDKFVTIDKYKAKILSEKKIIDNDRIEFIQMKVPVLNNIPDNEFDFVITFQVIEHIVSDKKFVEEIHRVLKNEGKLIVTTPNKKMSLTRNPWHIREYTISELDNLLHINFQTITKCGVFGHEAIMKYFKANKQSVEKITRYDIFKLQYILPRQLLQIPYDILNRMNRRKLLKKNTVLVSEISINDYYLSNAADECFDLFYIAKKVAMNNPEAEPRSIPSRYSLK